ncbi:diguanylate cyclase (GGDEF) domain-containing protein [Roseomonas rosea]|uniref:Diguanylate cyclase (GGDEF) domain-containing protein n=1 Tax=Muricoccus roseus TaxID=198092 RepID=A0A1M6GHN1_9PROT|nr:bifunctional diguanylate cyclase/phosphodiesterase [Roseomonas rosea]SHJ09459.1 diguanylate cyclase (GGDEF) domain-containing protein [Roseomonas rosea]
MAPVPRPAEEADRLLDVADIASFDKVTEDLLGAFVRVASDLLGVPISGVSLVGEHEQFFKAIKGLHAGATPRDNAFCAHAILNPDEVMVVPDLAEDPRFRSSEFVNSYPNLRFYAGAPLRGGRGHAVGTLCVMDHVPRQLTPALIDRLQDLARGVSAALSLRQAIHEVHRAARTDALTGVCNRKGMEEIFASIDPQHLGLLMIDLDGFKPINDTYGHAGGDKALVEVARRLRETVRAKDTVVRLGGDEFVVLVREVERPEAGLSLAARIHAAFADTFLLNGAAVPLRASIGFAASPWHASDVRTLMERADAALYAAKRAGRGVTRVADTSPGGESVGRTALEAWLREAFSPGGTVPFHLVFQPIADLPTGEVRSVEALLRWRTDTGLSLRPADVLPVIEGMGYSSALDRWVVGEACRLIAIGRPPHTISVNASASTFGVPGFDGQVQAILQQHGIGGDRLVIEMTEGSLAGDPEAALKNMHGLAEIGVRVVLDDFGGGHGTLARLRGYPFDAIKIDRSLVTDCARDTQGTALMEAVAGMAHALSVPVVAEGVENAAQLAVLARFGVERAQGFLVSRPVAWERLEEVAAMVPERIRAALAKEGAPAPA